MENQCGYDGPVSASKSKSRGRSSSRTNSSSRSRSRSRSSSRSKSKSQNGGGGDLITLSPTQGFVSNYYTTTNPLKGMLFWHSVGTGKTCGAIATATSSFEPEGYTILWVTRTTLKNDIWKNMFDQVCHARLRKEIENGTVMPDQQDARMKMLSNAWSIRPMSYKQFSNLVSKRNDLYKKLVKKNGEVDPLRKTLLIIDEAHKLYGGADLSSIERPDMNALHAALMRSYEISGPDSARLLLMTATPITSDPMELIKLINLMKPAREQIPSDFGDFAKEYLNEEGLFTAPGESKYLDQIAGHISYLNRENDARQFSQPILTSMYANIVKNRDELELIEAYDDRLVKIESSTKIDAVAKELEAHVKVIE